MYELEATCGVDFNMRFFQFFSKLDVNGMPLTQVLRPYSQ